MSSGPYSNVVGSIMHTMIHLDISQTMSIFSKYMTSTGKLYWQVVKCILQYLKGTSDVDLLFDKEINFNSRVIDYADSDYVRDLVDKWRSLIGMSSLCAVMPLVGKQHYSLLLLYQLQKYNIWQHKSSERGYLVERFAQ